MIRIGMFLMLVNSMGMVFLPNVSSVQASKQADAPVLAIERGGGFVIPDQNPLAYFWFKVAKDGAWEFKPLRGDTKKGKLTADEIGKWTKEIKDGGFDKLKSNPSLGAADESYMDITIRVDDKTDQKRIRLEEKLAQAIEKKVLELVKAGK